MKARTLLIFAVSVAVCSVAASHRFYDSAHTIGMIKADGGRARHPVLLDAGRDSYTIIATATVLPPYRGDVRVAVEGNPAMEYEIYPSEPALDLSPYRHPVFRDNVLYDLQPKDKVALWVVMKPKQGNVEGARVAVAKPPMEECCDPAADVPSPPPAVAVQTRENGYAREGQGRRGAWSGKPGHPGGREAGQRLAFYDTATGKTVLSVPIHYQGPGTRGGDHGVD